MKVINFIIDSLYIGGAEIVLVELANELSKDCIVNVFAIYDGPLSKNLNPQVNYKPVISVRDNNRYNYVGRINSLIKRICFLKFPNFFLKKEVVKDAPIIAFLENQSVKAVFNYRGENKKIAWIHTDIERQQKRFRHNEYVYNKFNNIVFSSYSAMDIFRRKYTLVNAPSMDVIYNGLNCSKIKLLAEKETRSIPQEEYSLSVGRLCDAKDYLGLLSALRHAYNRGYTLKHYIIGDGPDKKLIENKIIELELSNNVFLLGGLNNPYPYIKNSRLFVHNAKWEGFGLVIVEAAILNTVAVVRRTGATEELCSFLNTGYIYDSEDELIELLLKHELFSKHSNTLKFRELTYSAMKKKVLETIYD